MPLNIWVHLLIDRIHISVTIGSKDLYGFVLAQLKGMKDLQADLLPEGKITFNSVHYHTRIGYYPTKKRKIADIEIGVTKCGHKYFKLVLYPSKFEPGEFEHFQANLNVLLPEFCYAKLFETGKVSYIELAADSLTHPAHSFIPFRPKCNISSIFEEETGELGTTYIGSESGDLHFRIYDKHKLQLKQGLPITFTRRTRIESVSCRIGLSPCELVEKMPNPFLKLEIADLEEARLASKDTAWQDFLDLCLRFGSPYVLAQLSKYERTQCMKILRAAAAPWWNPHDCWPDLPRAMKVIAPQPDTYDVLSCPASYPASVQ